MSEEHKVYDIKESAAIADPGPLGLGGFALTTVAFTSAVAGLFVPHGAEGTWLPLALVYGGIVQLLAGMWEFKKGNTFGSTAFSTYGAFWIAAYLLVTQQAAYGVDKAFGATIGWYNLLFFIVTLIFWIATWKINWGLIILFGVLDITFLLLAIGGLSGQAGISQAGGYTGILTGLIAWYDMAAGVINFTYKRTVLPVGPIK